MTAPRNLFFFIKTSVLPLLLAAAVSFLIWIVPGDYNHDLAALVNKRDLLVSKKPPRIVFIGGSNISTLDSCHIERGLNGVVNSGYSVVNLGLWGGLSMARYLEEIKPYLAPGDSVIICQEYATLLSDSYFKFIHHNDEADKFFFLMKPSHMPQVCGYDSLYAALQFVPPLNQLKIKTYIAAFAQGDMTHHYTGGYYGYQDDYNVHGDRRFPFRIVRPLREAGARFPEPKKTRLVYLKKFLDYTRTRDIRLIFAFPPFPSGDYLANKNQINSLVRVIRDDLALDILTMPEALVYPESCFADTVNHLRPHCEKKRTSAWLEQLKKYTALHRPRL